ncbi:MAG: porin [Deltaproteobacteria bacterium]|nr:porin [Deltaproteobacteria bacterium]
MRRLPGLPTFAVPLFAVALLAPATAHAAEDDLPVGDEAPRFVPTAVADGYYAYHDTAPTGPTGSATHMTTASRHNEFAVNLAAIGARLEHAKLTGAVVLHAGTSVDALHALAPGDREIWKHIQLANVGWKAGAFHFEAGVLPSLVGRESFVSTSNWNYTRAFIADATPYYVTGARATWRVSPTWSLGAAIFNGWDTHGDRNATKSGQLRVAWTPSEKLSIETSALVGQEQVPLAGRTTPLRFFDDLIVALQVHKRVHLALEAWAGTERNYRFEDPQKGDARSATMVRHPWFYGGALWGKWQFGDTVYLAARAEALSDRAGVMASNGARQSFVPGAVPTGEPFVGQQLAGGTLTFGWQPHKSFLARVEALHRISDHPFFSGSVTEYSESVAGSSATYVTQARRSSTTFVVSAAFSY